MKKAVLDVGGLVICGGGRGHLGRPPGAPRTGGRGDVVE